MIRAASHHDVCRVGPHRLQDLFRDSGRGARPGARAGQRAFTLIEVILALSIATGLLIVALLFYRQATDLRAQILRESERNTATRLILERLATDLREAVVMPGEGGGFVGGPDSLSLVRPAPPDASSAAHGMIRVSFVTVRSNEGTNLAVVGIDRREQPLHAPVPKSRNRSLSFSFEPDPTNAVAIAAALRKPEILTEDIRLMRFRYWSGAGWVSVWTNGTPPTGVEIVVGPDPAETESSAAVSASGSPEIPEFDLGGDSGSSNGASTGGSSDTVLFRRVVFLPAGIASKRSTEESSTEFPPF